MDNKLDEELHNLILIDYVAVKDPFATPVKKEEPKPKIVDHLLDAPAVEEPEEKPYEVSKLLTDTSEELKNNA